MNKAEREKIAEHGLPTRSEWDQLCHYVDTLEAAAKETVHYFSSGADVTAKLREALTKGK